MNRSHQSFPGYPRPQSLRPRPARESAPGFTLVEMLVVIGIIIVLVGILFPVVFRLRRQADRQRTAADIQTISVALSAYKQDCGDYPRWNTSATASPAPTILGSALLGACLISPGAAAADGADGPGFRMRSEQLTPGVYYGLVHGPYLPPDKFTTAASGKGYQILDRNNEPFLYMVASVPAPNITSTNTNTTNPPYLVSSPQALYTMWSTDIQLFRVSGESTNTYAVDRIQMLLGDFTSDGAPTNFNGFIDPGETAAYTGDFIIWAAGPDKAFGLPNETANVVPLHADIPQCDDVTNFTFAQ